MPDSIPDFFTIFYDNLFENLILKKYTYIFKFTWRVIMSRRMLEHISCLLCFLFFLTHYTDLEGFSGALPTTVEEMRLQTLEEAQTTQLYDKDVLQALDGYHQTVTFTQSNQDYLEHPDLYVNRRIAALDHLISVLEFKEGIPIESMLTAARFKKAYLNAIPKGLNPYATKPELLVKDRAKAIQISPYFWFEFLDPLHRFDKSYFYLRQWKYSKIPNYFIFLETMEYNKTTNLLVPFKKYVKYYSESERNNIKLVFKDDLVLFKGAPAEGRLIFVLGLDGEFYGLEQEMFNIHHSSAFASGDILGAGELYFKAGKILTISNGSGHYRPSRTSMLDVLRLLIQKIGNINDIQLIILDTIHRMFIVAEYDINNFLNTNDDCLPKEVFIKGWTPLHYVVWNTQLQLIPLALNQKSINQKTEEGDTALHLAVMIGDDQAVKLLIAAGANPCETNNNNLSSLDLAAQLGQLKIFELLSQNMSLRTIGNQKKLYFNSIAGGNLEIIEKLEKMRIRLPTADSEGNTLYHYGTLHGNVQLFEHIAVKHPRLSISRKNREGKAPLSTAISNGNFPIFQYLAERTKSLSQIDQDGNSLLHLAAKGRNSQICEYLLQKIPEMVQSHNKEGLTPLHYLATNRLPTHLMRTMIELGVSIDSVDKDGNTPLYYSVESGMLENSQFLLEQGALPLLSNHLGVDAISKCMLDDQDALQPDSLAHLFLHVKKPYEEMLEVATQVAFKYQLTEWQCILQRR